MIAGLRYRARRASYRVAWSTLEKCTPTPEIKTLFERSSNGKNLGYVKRVQGLSMIEPTFGYVLAPSGFPIEDSLSFNYPQAPTPFQLGLPSPKMPAPLHFRSRTHTYDTVVSFRHHHEMNYFHFLIDVLGELELLDASGLAGNLSIVIGGRVAKTRFGSEILKMGDLASRNWIFQDDECIWAENIVFLQTFQQSRLRADHLLDLMKVPIPTDNDGDRLYLARPPGCRRSIVNDAEVAELLDKYGFREIVTDDLPLQEQIRLFQRARYVVGAHGAGLTNVIFRRGAPLALLELHAYSFLLDCYGRLCSEYGYFHDRIPCASEDSPSWGESRLWVDPSQLELKIRRLLADG
jgi:hypothetical protein